MKNSLLSVALAVALSVVGLAANASIIHFSFALSPANEVPPTASNGTGFVTLDLDTVAQTLAGHITFSGLTGNTTAAHIHCCLPAPFMSGTNVGVATLVPAFPGFPSGVTSGTDDFLLHLDSTAAYNPAFITAQGSLANAEAAFINGLNRSLTYLNIHTTNFGGGEIRGFVANAVPEPMTISLIGLGMIAAAFASRRNKRG